MKKWTFVLLFALGLPLASWSQVSFMVGQAAPNTGENVCIPVNVMDFSDLISFQLSFQYDPTVLDYTGVTVNLAGLTVGDFVADEDAGTITVIWNENLCSDPDADGVTLADGVTIFELCFDAIGAYGSFSDIEIVNSPLPSLFFIDDPFNNCAQGIPTPIKGDVTIGLRPFTLSVSNETGNPGDLVTVDVIVEQGWDALNSIQFSMYWDETVVLLENIIEGDNIPNFTANGNTANPTVDCATVSWASIPVQPAPSVADGEIFFQMTFRIIGDCEEVSIVDFKDSPTMIEVTNRVEEGLNLPFIGNPGSVTATDCDQIGIEVASDCGGPVNLNDQICIPVVAGTNFVDINNLDFLMEWNPNILEYAGTQNYNLPTLSGTNGFDATNTDNGILGLEWDLAPNLGQDRTPGSTLFEVCFNVIGLGGNSPFNIIPGTGEEGGTTANIVPTNCEVQVIQPAGVSMNINNAEAALGGQTCVPLTVSNFVNVIDYQFSLNWDPNIWDYVNIQTNVLSMTVGDAGAASGLLFFEWSDDTPVTLNDGDTILEICFTPDAAATPGECDLLQEVGLPAVAQAITSESNGNDVGVTTLNGELCVLFPEGFGMTVQDVSGLWQDTICVPVTVESFDNIVGATFDVSFDPGDLEFVGINYTGQWPDLDIDVMSANLGLLIADWASPTPVAINDGETVFELCFLAFGQADTCYNIDIIPQGSPSAVTDQGNGSIVVTNGELCVEDRLIITDVAITPETCDGAEDGSVILTVIGGTEPYGTNWQYDGEGVNTFLPLRIEGVRAGTIVYTLFDDSSPALIVTDSVEVPLLNADFPTVMVDQDTVSLSCATNQALVSATFDAALSSEWFLITETNLVPQGDTEQIFVTQAGSFLIDVIDPMTGCSDQDTVYVVQPDLPTAVIDTFMTATSFDLDCSIDTLMLDGSINSNGDGTLTYAWTANPSTIIVPGTEDSPIVGILGAGTVTLNVRDEISQCVSEATVITITDNGIIPVDADAGSNAEQNCGGTTTLSGIGSNNPGLTNLTFTWFDANGMQVGMGVEFEAGDVGEYTLQVTDNDSGCSATDITEVTPNVSAPQGNIQGQPEDQFISCDQDVLDLVLNITSTGGTYTVLWTSPDGGVIVPGTEMNTTAQVTAAGTYIATITNEDDNCQTPVEVVVTDRTEAPVAMVGGETNIDCNNTTTTLMGMGSTEGDTISYQWFFPDTDTPLAGETNIDYVASAGGTYTLVVTNDLTGCTASESIEVIQDGELPSLSAAEPMPSLDCDNNNLDLIVNVEPAGPTYTATWVATNSSPFTNGADQFTINVTAADTYTVTVVNDATGCSQIFEFVVGDDSSLPQITLADDMPSLTCDSDEVTLDASLSPDAANSTFEWTGPDPDLPFAGPTVTVQEAGTYTVSIRNDNTGCTNTMMVEVGDNTTEPSATVGDVATLDCDANETATIALTVGDATDFTVTWENTSGGAAPNPTTGEQTEVSEGGTYQYTIVNNETGCTTIGQVMVNSNKDEPEIMVVEPGQLGCTGTVTIDASQSGNAADFSDISWDGPAGATITPPNGLSVEVDQVGQYTLTLTGLNGCTSMQTINISPNQDLPTADAGENFSVQCDEETFGLDGSGSDQGPDIRYEWSSGDTDLMPEVSEPGTYTITVINDANGCTSTAEVTVTRELPEDAVAGDDSAVCGNVANLMANLPDGVTGQWTSNGTAVVVNPTDAATAVTDLGPGANVFVWTLSAGICGEYSSDEIIISQAEAPITTPDQLDLMGSTLTGSVNVLDNDFLNGATNVTVSIVGDPEFGVVESISPEGLVTYSAPVGIAGVARVEYQVCNADCPDLCATGSLIINLDIDENIQLPNTITPNGDGLNETLVFDIINFTPAEDIPDNELVIFNRWGDIVFEAQPYTNNWDGLNEQGEELPEGTYYYILRLNIAEGLIYRGDITIVR